MTDILKLFLQVSLMAGGMIGIVWLIRRIFSKKMSPAVILVLWGIVLMRLVFPFTFTSPVSFSGILAQTVAAVPSVQERTLEAGGKNNQILEPGNANLTQAGTHADTAVQQTSSGAPPTAAAEQSGTALSDLLEDKPIWDVLAAVWITGFAITLGLFAVKAARFKRKLRFCKKVTNGRILSIVAQHKRSTGIKKSISILKCDFVGAPAVFGYFKPCILIPANFVREMDKESLGAILLHEVYHIRCHDILKNYLWLAAKALHWFNPLVWLAYRRYCDDVEVRRDENTANILQGTFEYTKSLLEAARFSKQTKSIPSLTNALFENECKLKQRVLRLVKPQRKTKSAVITSSLLALLMIVTCFTTACQPTPEEPIVYQKTEVYQESEAAAALTKESIEVPDHVDETHQLGEKLTLNIDSDVMITGDLDSYKVYKGVLTDFTQEQVDGFADLLVGDTPLTGYDDRYTKDEIMEYFLLPSQQTLAELKADTYIQDPNMDGDIPTIESMEEIIEMYKQWIEQAPEERSNDTVSAEDYTANGDYIYGEFPIEGSKITGKFIVGESDRNRYGGLSFYNSGYDLMEPHNVSPDPLDLALPEEGLDLQITQEEAVQRASELKDSLGADELDFFAVMQARAWVEEMGTGMINAYYVVFTRRFDNVPGMYIPDTAATSGFDEWQTFEKLIVTIDDSGVLAVNWMGNTKITDVLNEAPEFIGFDAVLAAAKNQIKSTYSYMAEAEADIENRTLKINSISLEYLRMKEPNGSVNDVRFVPAWVFCGTLQSTYTDEAIENNEYLQGKVSAYEIRTPIVVNALDGSAFNPRFLDGIEPDYEEQMKPNLPDDS